MNKTATLISLIIIQILLFGCLDGPRVILAPDYEVEEYVQATVSNYTPAPSDLRPTPTLPPFSIANDSYTLSSQAMSFLPPTIWKIDKENVNYVKFKSRDQRAWFEAGYESTGYDLEPEAFKNYTDNALASLYGRSEDFEIVEDMEIGVRRVITSRFMNNGLTWYAFDAYIQRNFVIYFFSFHTLESEWDYYQHGFMEIYESLETKTGYVDNDQLYEFTSIYIDPGNVFRVRKPIGWGVSGVEEIDDKTQIESIQSPDGLASMRTIIYSSESELTPDNIGQTAIGLLREIIAEDMVFTGDQVLPDGRIRLNWVSAATNTSGFSFFWLNEFDLYLLSFIHDIEKEGICQQANYQIGDSFFFIE